MFAPPVFQRPFFAAVFVFAYLNLHRRFLQGFFRVSKETGKSREVFLVVPADKIWPCVLIVDKLY